jgi:hypothetical protein
VYVVSEVVVLFCALNGVQIVFLGIFFEAGTAVNVDDVVIEW